jgi:carbonic anhydrase
VSVKIDYTNEINWGNLCNNGINQSPINFPDISSDNYNISSDYIKIKQSNYELFYDMKLELLYQYKYWINLTDQGNIQIYKNGTEYMYKLEYLQFHSPSEHMINGTQFDLEIQIKHKKNEFWLYLQGVDYDPDVTTRDLFISILYKAEDINPDNLNISSFNFNTSLPVQGFDLNTFFNDRRTFIYYSGSITNPPCSEHIDRIIFDKIEPMSTSQLKQIKNWINSVYPKGNSRKVKPIQSMKLYYKPSGKSHTILSNLTIFIVLLSLIYLF